MEIKKFKRMPIILFEDSVGISDGYKGIYNKLLAKGSLDSTDYNVITRSAYRNFQKKHLLEWRKNIKQPRFNSNPDMQQQVRSWVKLILKQHKAQGVICQDPALLFLLNPEWSQASLDTLRGGVYIAFGIPWIVTLPLTAWHSKAKAKDIAKLNEGFVEKGDFEEYRAALESEDVDEDDIDLDEDENNSMAWHEPIVFMYGRIVLEWDFQKMGRLMKRQLNHMKVYKDESTTSDLLGQKRLPGSGKLPTL